eukprot:719395_1
MGPVALAFELPKNQSAEMTKYWIIFGIHSELTNVKIHVNGFDKVAKVDEFGIAGFPLNSGESKLANETSRMLFYRSPTSNDCEGVHTVLSCTPTYVKAKKHVIVSNPPYKMLPGTLAQLTLVCKSESFTFSKTVKVGLNGEATFDLSQYSDSVVDSLVALVTKGLFGRTEFKYGPDKEHLYPVKLFKWKYIP